MEKLLLSGLSQKKAAACLLLWGVLLSSYCSAGLLPPVISVPPLSQSVQQYGSVTFSVVAVSLTTMTFQWRKNGVDIPGADQSTYTISPVIASDAGLYSVYI